MCRIVTLGRSTLTGMYLSASMLLKRLRSERVPLFFNGRIGCFRKKEASSGGTALDVVPGTPSFSSLLMNNDTFDWFLNRPSGSHETSSLLTLLTTRIRRVCGKTPARPVGALLVPALKLTPLIPPNYHSMLCPPRRALFSIQVLSSTWPGPSLTLRFSHGGVLLRYMSRQIDLRPRPYHM